MDQYMPLSHNLARMKDPSKPFMISVPCAHVVCVCVLVCLFVLWARV